jgi:hypothetical protein
LSKKNLKALSLTGGEGEKGMREDDTLSQRSNSTRITLSQTLQQPTSSLEPLKNMHAFLQNVSPEVRRAIQQITGTHALQKQVKEIVNQTISKNEGNGTLASKLQGGQKIMGKNVQNSLYLKSLGSIDRIHAEKDRM